MNDNDKKVMLGDVSLDELAAAQKTVTNVLFYISENADTEDEEIKANIRTAFTFIAIDDMVRNPLCKIIARKLADGIHRDEEAKKAKMQPIAAFRATEKS